MLPLTQKLGLECLLGTTEGEGLGSLCMRPPKRSSLTLQTWGREEAVAAALSTMISDQLFINTHTSIPKESLAIPLESGPYR